MHNKITMFENAVTSPQRKSFRSLSKPPKENGGISEVLRRWGIHSSDLTRIRKAVEESAISNFKARKSRKPKIDYEQYQEIKAEKERLEYTIIEQAAELALLKKKDRSA